MKYLDTKKGSLEEAVQQSMSGVVAKDLLEAGGKYLKYSDLLLQKGRLMAKGKNTAMIDKEISKEMKKLGIKESKDEYEKFFNSALKKFKIDSPADLKTDAKKKEFFNYVDKNYKAKAEELDKDDEKTIKKVIGKLKKASDAHAGQAKTLSKDLQDETDKNVDETLDKIREANVAKQKSMREILADIWKMNEGKNPFDLEEQNIKIMFDMIPDKDFDNFAKKNKLKTKVIKPGRNTDEVEVTGDKKAIEKLLKLKGETLSDYKMDSRTKRYMYDEGFASDAQRRAAFASGYKEKGKKKKEEVEKDGKTATGQKPTKVEIEPEVK